MGKITKYVLSKDFLVVFGTIFGTLLYCAGIVFILDLGKFYAGGISGIAQLIDNLTGNKVEGLKSIIIAIMNLPLLLMAWRGVSRKFAILSVVSVILQIVFVYIFELMYKNGFRPFDKMKDDVLSLAILGGLILGAGEGVSLRYGSSTGGLDIISQYLAINKQVSFAKFSLMVDLTIIIVAGITQDITVAAYTCIRLIITVLVLDKLHTAYKFGKVSIITDEKQRMRELLLSRFKHGITIYQAMGAYSNKPRYVLDSIIYTFEAEEYIKLARSIDPNCFISYSSIKSVSGSFNINVIA